MFTFDENGENFLKLDLPETIMLLVTICLVALVAILCVTMFFAKRKYFAKCLTISLWGLLAYAVALIITNIVLNWSDFSEMYQLYVFVGLFIIVAAIVILAVVRKNKSQSNASDDVRAIAYAAICLAVSFALSYVKLFRMPQGGSVTLGSVMLLGLYSYMFGVKRGVLACLVYGILQSLQDPWIVHPIQFVLDYPLAYTMFGFVGVLKGKLNKPRLELTIGFAIAIVLRYLCHFFSGSIYFGDGGVEMGIVNKWAWGALYNLTVPVDGAIACVLAVCVLSSKQVRNIVLSEGKMNEEPQEMEAEVENK